ncbi:MAG: DUF5630 domain-containing protein [Gammaproteobacteria bacterium]|nr:DUF5630 domain-containing protein [Gammaproteobacteria bacterium]
MNKKGLSHNSIVEKFRDLHQRVLAKKQSNDVLIDFVQYYAVQSLPMFLEATSLEADLETLCCDDTLSSFWDTLITSEDYLSLLELDGQLACYQLKPQSSLLSYFLIKGVFYYSKHLELQRVQTTSGQATSKLYLMKALSSYNFHAFCDYLNEIIVLADRALAEDKKVDLSEYNKFSGNLYIIGRQFGAAGFLMLANLNLPLFKYFGQVEKSGRLFYKYLYEAYFAILLAERLGKYYLNDSFNALHGNQLASLLNESFDSILTMKDYIKNTIVHNKGNSTRIASIETEALELYKKWVRSHYQEEYFTRESLLCLD